MNIKKLLTLLTTTLVFGCGAEPNISSDISSTNYETKLVIKDDGIPWGMTWLPNGEMLVSYRDGQLKRYSASFELLGEVTGLPAIEVGRQGGLLDVYAHQTKDGQHWVYFSYSRENDAGDKSTAIMRAKLKGNSLVEKQDIYIAQAYGDKGVHFGSRIAFDDAGYLYFSIGDRGQRDINPQDITRDAGKVYRLNEDGTVPKDNPFAHLSNAKTAIYSFGHRNPQGMIKHPKSGEIWVHEHGPKGGDEINIIAKGENYGWPVVSYGVNYSGTKFTDLTEKKGMTQPAWYWDPSIAPSGMTYISSDKYPNWQGKIAVGSLKFGYVVLLTTKGNKVVSQEKAFEGLLRVRNVQQGPDGYLYIGVDTQGIYRVEKI